MLVSGSRSDECLGRSGFHRDVAAPDGTAISKATSLSSPSLRQGEETGFSLASRGALGRRGARVCENAQIDLRPFLARAGRTTVARMLGVRDPDGRHRALLGASAKRPDVTSRRRHDRDARTGRSASTRHDASWTNRRSCNVRSSRVRMLRSDCAELVLIHSPTVPFISHLHAILLSRRRVLCLASRRRRQVPFARLPHTETPCARHRRPDRCRNHAKAVEGQRQAAEVQLAHGS